MDSAPGTAAAAWLDTEAVIGGATRADPSFFAGAGSGFGSGLAAAAGDVDAGPLGVTWPFDLLAAAPRAAAAAKPPWVLRAAGGT